MFTREEIMNNPTVHNLTKQVLELSAKKDVVDRYFDVKLALDILKQEMDMAMNADHLTYLEEHLRQIDSRIVEDQPCAIIQETPEIDDLTVYSFTFFDDKDGEKYDLRVRCVLHDRENYPLTYHYSINIEGYQYHFDIRDIWRIAGVVERKDWKSEIREDQLKVVANEIIMHFDAMLELIERAKKNYKREYERNLVNSADMLLAGLDYEGILLKCEIIEKFSNLLHQTRHEFKKNPTPDNYKALKIEIGLSVGFFYLDSELYFEEIKEFEAFEKKYLKELEVSKRRELFEVV